MQLFVFLITTYLCASMPVGLVVSNMRGIDIRTVGSGNIGATNVSRALGLPFAILVGLLDFVKGFVPVFLSRFFFTDHLSLVLIASVALLGHVFSFFLKGKGGKGVATYAGTVSVLIGWPVFLLLLLLWVACLYGTKLMSLTNLVLSIVVVMLVFATTGSLVFTLYALLAGCLIWWTHRANIRRLLEGTENKLKI